MSSLCRANDFSHVKYFGYYSLANGSNMPGDIRYIKEVVDHNNLIWVRGGDWLDKVREAETRGAKVILMVDMFFRAADYSLLPNYQQIWETVRAQALPYSDTIIAFYTIDEPYARALENNMSPEQMKSNIETLQRMIKNSFPQWFSMLNFSHGEIPTYDIPAYTDWVAVDYYGDWNSFHGYDWWPENWRQATANIKTMEQQLAALKSKMTTQQKIFLIPESFIQRSKPVTEEILISRFQKYVEYAAKDKSVIGVFPFMYGNYSDSTDSYQGARELPSLLATMKNFARTIVAGKNQQSLHSLDLLALKKTNTDSGKLEVHRLSAESQFQIFNLQTATALDQVDNSWQIKPLDWDRDGIVDLAAIKTRNTGSGFVEVHILSGVSNYKKFIAHLATSLPENNSQIDFYFSDWDRDTLIDLVYLKKSETGSNRTEVHILSGQSLFKQFILQIATALPLLNLNNSHLKIADFDKDGLADLIYIIKNNSGSGKIEMHVLSGSSSFQSYIYNVATGLSQSLAAADFVLSDWTQDGQLDLIYLLRQDSGSQQAEAHMLNGSGNLQQFILQRTLPFRVESGFEFVTQDLVY